MSLLALLKRRKAVRKIDADSARAMCVDVEGAGA